MGKSDKNLSSLVIRLSSKKNIHQYCWALIARQYLLYNMI